MAPRKQKTTKKKAPPGGRRTRRQQDASSSASSGNDAPPPAVAPPGAAGFASFSGAGGLAVASQVANVSSGASAFKNPYKKDTIAKIKKPPCLKKLDFLSSLQFSPNKGRTGNKTSTEGRSSRLVCAVIGGGDCAVIFRFEPEGPYSSWPEKILFDVIRRRESWTQDLNFEERCLKWCVDDRPMFNAQNFPIRLFVIPFLVLPPRDQLVVIGKSICEMVNAEPSNTSIARVDPANFFWIPEETTYQTIISVADTIHRLRDRVGNPTEGWFEPNRAKILSYFAPQSCNTELARLLFAPPYMIHPRFAGQGEDDGEEDEDAEDEEDAEDGDDDDDDEDLDEDGKIAAKPDEDEEAKEENMPDEKELRDAFQDSDDEGEMNMDDIV